MLGKAQAGWHQYSGKNLHLGYLEKSLFNIASLRSPESVQWFLSNAPVRQHVEYVKINYIDRRVRALEQSPSRSMTTIGAWLSSKNIYLLYPMHLTLLPTLYSQAGFALCHPMEYGSQITANYVDLVKFLLISMPESLDINGLIRLFFAT